MTSRAFGWASRAAAISLSWKRIELVEKQNGRAGILALAAFGFQFVADFAAGDQDVLGVGHVPIGNDLQKVRLRKVIESRAGIGMAQHALWSEDDQRLAPRTAGLATQHVKILRGAARLANLNIVFSGELQKAFDAGAGMFRALAFKTMREEVIRHRTEDPIYLHRR